MVFDHIIIGSGLTALATVLGLGKSNSVCVVAGRADAQIRQYPQSHVPLRFDGSGGLGSYWHGVIPFGMLDAAPMVNATAFHNLFAYFYPREDAGILAGQEALFVPRRPIRPMDHWAQANARFKTPVQMGPGFVRSITRLGALWQVTLDNNEDVIVGKHVWLAAGALGTARLLTGCPGFERSRRKTVSDHFILSLGLVDRKAHPGFAAPVVKRGRQGTWFLRSSGLSRDGLVMLRPARFSYSNLDANVAERHVFGLPAGGILKKMARAPSAGLVSEALFNKFGLFGKARFMNAYAQVRIADCFDFAPPTDEVSLRKEHVSQAIHGVRHKLAFPELMPSRQPELFSHGIHLHGSVDAGFAQEMQADGFHIVDASAISDIGHAHHSFKIMTLAHGRARQFD